MSTETSPPSDEGSPAPLQFDRAEFASGAALNCAVCKVAISGDYFLANNHPVCPACRAKLQSGSTGSGPSQFARALGAGFLAALAGGLVYWLVLKLTGIEFGLLAVAVGWGVGYAVHWGAKGRGGILYQLMAVALTYVAIASMYMPDILNSPSFQKGTMALIPKLIIAFGISFIVPWMAGVSNILGWIIIAIGLRQAWVMNRSAQIKITGPFRTQTAPTPPPLAT
jgi:hypothetical protein